MSETRKKPSKKSANKQSAKAKSSVKILHDVTAPGKTPAASTSRPVIVGHRTTIKQDPMVIDGAPKDMTEKDLQMQTEELLRPLVDSNFEPTTTKSAKGKDIQPDNPDVTADEDDREESLFTLPISDADDVVEDDKMDGKQEAELKDENQSKNAGSAATTAAAGTVKSVPKDRAAATKDRAADPAEDKGSNDDVAEASPKGTAAKISSHHPAIPANKAVGSNETDSKDTPASDKAKSDAASGDASDKSKKKADQDAAPDEHDAVVKTLTDEVAKKQEDKQDKAEADAQEAQIRQLVDSKKYFVPIGQVSRRKSNRRAVLILLLVIVLSVVALNFAVDADLIEIGIDPYTNIL